MAIGEWSDAARRVSSSRNGISDQCSSPCSPTPTASTTANSSASATSATTHSTATAANATSSSTARGIPRSRLTLTFEKAAALIERLFKSLLFCCIIQ